MSRFDHIFTNGIVGAIFSLVVGLVFILLGLFNFGWIFYLLSIVVGILTVLCVGLYLLFAFLLNKERKKGNELDSKLKLIEKLSKMKRK